jgi:nicotinamide-nucleotide amidase
MKWLIDNEIIPFLIKKYSIKEIIHYKVLKTIDLGESNVDDLIGDIMESSRNPTVGVLAHPGQVDVRIAVKAKSPEEAKNMIEPIEKKITDLLGDHIFATNDVTLEECLGKLLDDKNITISTIENISGGAISEAFQSSTESNFKQGIITSSEKTLISLANKENLKINSDNPIEFALGQAKLIKELSGSDLGLAYYGKITGDKSVENLATGESYFAIVSDSGYDTKHIRSAGNGKPDKRRSVMNALGLARKFILKNL